MPCCAWCLRLGRPRPRPGAACSNAPRLSRGFTLAPCPDVPHPAPGLLGSRAVGCPLSPRSFALLLPIRCPVLSSFVSTVLHVLLACLDMEWFWQGCCDKEPYYPYSILWSLGPQTPFSLTSFVVDLSTFSCEALQLGEVRSERCCWRNATRLRGVWRVLPCWQRILRAHSLCFRVSQI